MPNLVYTIPIPQELLSIYLFAFASQTGWQEKVNIDGELVDNPITATEYARLTLNRYVQENVSSYMANKAAEDARQAVLEATNLAMGDIITILTIEP